MNMESDLRLFKALSEETRYRIVRALLDGEKCACEIPALIGRTQSNTSMHLAKLLGYGIVSSRREGKKIIYTIDNESVYGILDIIDASHGDMVQK